MHHQPKGFKALRCAAGLTHAVMEIMGTIAGYVASYFACVSDDSEWKNLWTL